MPPWPPIRTSARQTTPTMRCFSTCGPSGLSRRTRRGATNWLSWYGSVNSPLHKRLQLVQKKAKHILLGKIVDRAGGERPLRFDHTAAAAAAGVPDHSRLARAGIEHQFDVILRPPV